MNPEEQNFERRLRSFDRVWDRLGRPRPMGPPPPPPSRPGFGQSPPPSRPGFGPPPPPPPGFGQSPPPQRPPQRPGRRPCCRRGRR